MPHIPTDTIQDSSYNVKNYNKNPLRNRIISIKATARAPGTTRPVVSIFLGPNGCLVGNYVISQWVWALAFVPRPTGMRATGC